ncbi:MAG: hypothetical protein ACREML_13800 [Vulcanimicrobiaceae bacterium]
MLSKLRPQRMHHVPAPDSGPPLHVHEKESETYYVPHRYKNIGVEPGRVLFGFTPGGIEAFFTEIGDQTELNPQIMTEIARRHGITIFP